MVTELSHLALISHPGPAHSLTCVTCSAVAHNLLGIPIPVAGSSEVSLAPGPFGAGTRPALAPIWQPWVPMETSNAPAGKGVGVNLQAARPTTNHQSCSRLTVHSARPPCNHGSPGKRPCGYRTHPHDRCRHTAGN